MLAAVSRLRDVFGEIPIQGFAFVRTTSFEAVTANPVPVVCLITLVDGRPRRDP